MTLDEFIKLLAECGYMTFTREPDGTLYCVIDGNIVLPVYMAEKLIEAGVEEI